MTTAFTPKFAKAADLKKEIGLIEVAGKKLDERIQTAALSVLFHVDAHGDVTVAAALFNALPKGARKNALAEWFMACGKMALNQDPATKKDLPFLYDKERTTDFDKGIANPWYTFKPEVPVDQAFDFQGQLQALIKRAQSAQKAGKEVKGMDVLTQVQSIRMDAVQIVEGTV